MLDISKGKSLLENNALKDRFIDLDTEQIATYSEQLSKEVTSGRLSKEVFNKLVNDKVIELDKNRKEALKNISASTYLKTFQGLNEKMFPGGKDEKASFLTPTEKKSTSNRYHLGELNYELLSTKEKNAMDAKLEKAGLKPSSEVLKTNPEIKNAYQKLIVNYVLKEREILSKVQESALNQKQIDAFKNSAIKEVKTMVTTLKAREKAAFEVKISYKDPSTGKIVSKLVDSRDPSLNAEQSKLAKKALAEKEETRILKERDKVEKEWKAANDKILEQKLLDAASEARIRELTSYSQQEWVDAMTEQPDPDKRAKMLEERKLKEHAAEIREIQSIQIEKRVERYVDNSLLGQGENGGAYKTVINTFDELKSIDIDKHIKELSDTNPKMTEDTKKQIRESLELIKKFKSAEDFANQTKSALCNIITGWEAAMIAGRKVEPDFAKFYVEQVKLGAITVDTHGKNEAVFYGTSKEYLGPSELLSDAKGPNLNFSTQEGRGKIIDYLESTPSRVAMVHLDYEGDGKGDHFVVAYKNSQGEWIIKDHNETGKPSYGRWKYGGLLSDAVDKGKIKDIRLVK